jgi:putative addiction module component (TIGR02574 family)
MTPRLQALGIDRLDAAERLRLIGEIWDSIEPGSVEIPEWHKEILDARLKAMEENPGAGSSWEEVKARLWKQS